MDHNLVIEGEDFKLEVESADFEFIAAIQAFVAEMVAESEVEYEIVWDDEEEEDEE
jgi:hypothetical protein